MSLYLFIPIITIPFFQMTRQSESFTSIHMETSSVGAVLRIRSQTQRALLQKTASGQVPLT